METMNRPTLAEIDALAADLAYDSGEHVVELSEGTREVYIEMDDFPEEESCHLLFNNQSNWTLAVRERSHKLAHDDKFHEREFTRSEHGLAVQNDYRPEYAGPRTLLRAKYILEGMRRYLELQ